MMKSEEMEVAFEYAYWRNIVEEWAESDDLELNNFDIDKITLNILNNDSLFSYIGDEVRNEIWNYMEENK